MATRRDFLRSVAGAAVTAALPGSAGRRAPHAYAAAPGRRKRPLVELQQRFLDRRFGMFLHFNMATFQEREWGDPTAPPDRFHPTGLDTDQWAAAARAAHMTWGCLTTKHHDGFCIWPTRTRSASVRRTRHRTDVVRAYADSFRKQGLRVALYYSILDLREDIRHFNVTPDKVRLIKDQLRELLTEYGPIDAIVTDGWNAPWSRITYEEVPYHEVYALVKRLQPDCLLSDLNASEYPAGGLYYTDLKALEQNAGQQLVGENVLPAYSCVTLTKDWFWKERDHGEPLKPTSTVVGEWLGPLNARHCTVLLNAPPTREGRLAPNVVRRLEEIGRAWHHPGPAERIESHVVITTPNLATGRPGRASSSPDTVGPDQANDGRFESTWSPADGRTSGWVEVDLGRERPFNVVSLSEPVGRWDEYRESRIERYTFRRWDGAAWKDLVAGARPGSAAIHAIPRVSSRLVRLTVEGSRATPHVADVGVYDEPAY